MRHIVATSLWHMVTIMSGGGAEELGCVVCGVVRRVHHTHMVTTRVVAEPWSRYKPGLSHVMTSSWLMATTEWRGRQDIAR